MVVRERTRSLVLGVSVVGTLLFGVEASAADYQHDIGSELAIDTAVVPVSEPLYVVAMNRFVVQPGKTAITSVEFEWYAEPDDQMEAVIWRESDGDGLPNDLTVAWSTVVSGTGEGERYLATVAAPQVEVGSAGERFFVGLVTRTIVEFLEPVVGEYPSNLFQ